MYSSNKKHWQFPLMRNIEKEICIMFSFLANLVDSLGFWISILMIGFIVYAILYTKFHKKKPKKWVKPETSEKVQHFINFFSSDIVKIS